MAVGRYFNTQWNQPVSMYVPQPFDTLALMGQETQKRHDKRQSEMLDILGKQFNTLPQDYQSALKAKKDIDNTISDWAGKDYSDPMVVSGWNQKRRELANRFGPQGDIGSMQSNFDSHKEYVKHLDELKNKGPKDGGIDLDTYNKLKNTSFMSYSGIGEKGDYGYNQYKGIPAANHADIAGAMDDYAKGWKENKKASEHWQEDENGLLYKMRGYEKEYINPEEVKQGTLKAALNNPMLRAYAKQQAMLNSNSPEEANHYYNKMFSDAGDYIKAKYGYSKTGYKEDLKFTPWAKEKYNEDKSNNYSDLPNFEGNTSNTPVTNGQALANLGITGLNDDGSVQDPNYIPKGKLYGIPGAPAIEGTGNDSDSKNSIKEKYLGLVKAGATTGVLSKYITNGKVDYKALEDNLVEIGKNIGKSSSGIPGLQSDLSDNMTNLLLGKHSKEGFIKSPLVEKMTMYINGNPNNKVNEEEKVKLAENGKIIGLDFNDPNLGALTLTATMGKDDVEPKLYNGITPDRNLKARMEPIHTYTQQFNKLKLNNLSSKEKENNTNTSNRIIEEYSKSINNSKYPNEIKKQLLNNFQQAYSSIITKPNQIVLSQDRNFKGDKSYIGTVTYENNQPIEKVLVLDRATGNIEIKTLGDIQQEESNSIQKTISGGYNKKAPGYIPKDEEYTQE